METIKALKSQYIVHHECLAISIPDNTPNVIGVNTRVIAIEHAPIGDVYWTVFSFTDDLNKHYSMPTAQFGISTQFEKIIEVQADVERAADTDSTI